MKKKNDENCQIHQTTGSLAKKVIINTLKHDIEDIKSISTIYQKIDNNKRYKITIIISEEPDYTDV
jgi:hypothetical protein